MSTTKSTDSAQNPILFGKDRPYSILLSQLYDPDVHGYDPSASGKIIPGVGTLVIDDASDGIAYYVRSVDPNTYKSTLRPLRFLETDDGPDSAILDSIVTYGSDRFVCYYDDRVRPVSLTIDGKLYILGSSKIEYRLVRTNSNGENEIVSLYLDSDEQYKGNRIPLTTVINTNGTIKICTNCHTLHNINEGEILTLQIFNANGQQTEEYHIVCKRSIIQDDLMSDSNPIVAFDADATQMTNDEFYLYENQSPTALNITPFATYADGSTNIFTIDNRTCFMYGFEKDNIPSYPGRRFKILIKKFLSSREVTDIDSYDRTHRSVCCEKWVNIIKNDTEYSLKLTIIPWYDNNAQHYRFKFFAYTSEREHIYDVTNDVVIAEGFDPMEYNKEQYLKVTFDSDIIFHNGVITTYQQAWWITLREPGVFESYILKDSKNDEYAYGAESSTAHRPVIHYDATLGQYYVPTSKFANENAFLEAFYKFARPPYDTKTELEPTVPTHFTIRAIDNGNVLISTPIPVEQYNQLWNIVRLGNSDQLVDGIVLVEFLKLVGSEYNILYGVPVDVQLSALGYNREGNNITGG